MYNKESNVLLEYLYVDDLHTGEDSVEAGSCSGLQELMTKSGFTVAKWASSHPEILGQINPELQFDNSIRLSESTDLKTLGVKWNPKLHSFSFYEYESLTNIANETKRSITNFWTLSLEWDNEIPANTLGRWMKWVNQISRFSQLRFERSFNMDSKVDAEARRVALVAPTTPIFTIYDVNIREHLTTSLRIVCYVLRAVDAFNGKVVSKSLVLSAYENKRALLLLIRTLNPFFDMKEEIIRIGPRIRTSPVLLPAVKDGLVTKLILQHHRSNLRAVPNQTLHSLRHRYWIVKGFCIVKQVISIRCFVCKRFKSFPHQHMMSVLPEERINPGMEPFRAVHLELVEDMTRRTFVMALTRMINRRGMPKVIISDNAKAFKSASIQLKEVRRKLDMEPISRSKPEVQWKRVVGKPILKETEFVTFLTKVEAKINFRPLARVTANAEDFDLISPDMIIIVRKLKEVTSKDLLSLHEQDKVDETPEEYTKQHNVNEIEKEAKIPQDKINKTTDETTMETLVCSGNESMVDPSNECGYVFIKWKEKRKE
ncbi:unnamed protein product [Lepeophtheirus salmonis]|uniref:(salmon louse) hypothetical protein n=1 Tax=Lepeophtheirus salmonis TaxID=72036 RepID=A0A7R8H7Q8_LEPSM|nr:unnamed protein product [Lepeophtheirus salmonis]CAF2925248.1 unnamed protein product [Lepeophtheirus salmonis]